MRSFAELLRRVLNKLFLRFLGGSERPVFFDVEATCPELRRIDADHDAIRGELMGLLSRTAQIPRYHEVDEAQAAISAQGDRDWRVFFTHLHRAEGRLPGSELCPRTVEVVRSIPNVLQSFFSILDARKSVPAHAGPYLGYLRYHAALVVPDHAPPRMRVKDRFYTWKERQGVLFDDSWSHEVFNESDGIRVVLVVDVLRPMPWPLHALNLLARRVFFARPLVQPAIDRMHHIFSQPDAPSPR